MTEPKVSKAAESDASTVKLGEDQAASRSSTQTILKEKSPAILNSKRLVAPEPSDESKDSKVTEVGLSQNRTILRAARRWTTTDQQAEKPSSKDSNTADENTDPSDALPRPKFVFGSQFQAAPVTTQDEGATKKPFVFSFNPPQKTEEQKGTPVTFGATFRTEAKMFANKNLFANPMIINSTKPLDTKAFKVKMKGEETSSKVKKPPIEIQTDKNDATKG